MTVYEKTVRDRLWMWGHDAGSLKNTFGFGSKGGMILPGDACKYMDIPNVCMVRFTGTPSPPYDNYMKQFSDAKRLTWGFVDGDERHTTLQKKEQALDLARRYPNLAGLDMDDFFCKCTTEALERADSDLPVELTPDQIGGIRKEMSAINPDLELSLVIYSHQIYPVIKRYIDRADRVYFWTWWAKDIPNMEKTFRDYRKIISDKRTLLGIYMWDFGDSKPISPEMMEHQCGLGLEWLKKGEIEGLIFHCTPLCDMNLESVEWSREWIKRHADEKVG